MYNIEKIKQWAAHPDNKSFERQVVLDCLAEIDRLRGILQHNLKEQLEKELDQLRGKNE